MRSHGQHLLEGNMWTIEIQGVDHETHFSVYLDWTAYLYNF